MIEDLLTVFWKEAREILEMSGPRGGRIRLLLWLGVFGVFLPFQLGEAWLSSPAALLLWSWFAFFVVANTAAGLVAGERENHTLETLLATRLPDRAILFGKVAAAAAYGWVLTLGSMVGGMITVNLTTPGGLRLLTPVLALGGPLLALVTAIAAGGLGVHVSLYAPTVRQAQQTLSLATLLLFFVPAFGAQALPAAVKARLMNILMGLSSGRTVAAAAVALALLDAALLITAAARFRRERLILD